MSSESNSTSPPPSPQIISNTFIPSSPITQASPSSTHHSNSTIFALNPNMSLGDSSPPNILGLHTMATPTDPASSLQLQTQNATTQILIPPTTLAMIPKLSSGNFHAWKMRLETCLGAYKL
ncbi:hypothetical protein CROQUDRAFT_95037 [Cronartium quercuum f. sp. fusiforme G11]|uniref:Uncharacterized protein n=1 Tax=Cronartium quercuum f. sp. fusiforme G11 TaxID=708437 RepID=A0A9P6TBB3_9BASI|nr:hypothetical protein CROQUDRAFT_95037 [Cronartium quercuum f. sp. fusiforme G11]